MEDCGVPADVEVIPNHQGTSYRISFLRGKTASGVRVHEQMRGKSIGGAILRLVEACVVMLDVEIRM